MRKTKKLISLLTLSAVVLSFTACNSDSNKGNGGVNDADLAKLIADYEYQWDDPSKPILNDKGASEISFNIYSSKNASALDYNDMKIMQDLFEQTNVNVTWENVSESIYSQQKNLIFGNASDRPDAIYHAGMSAGEIIKYAKRKILLPISDYLDYMPNFKKILEERPDIKQQLINVEDGKIYSLPRIEEMGLLQNPNLLFINKNWVKQVIDAGKVSGITEADLKDGLSLTSAQMEDILTYFRDNDMNGNGDTKDERPFNFVWNNWQGNQWDLYGMFGVQENGEHRVVIDDTVTYTLLDDKYKEATNFIADWVSKGLIDKVSFEQSQDNFLANGKNLELYGAFYWWESETVVSNPENYILCAPLKGPNGDQNVCVSNSNEVSAGELIIFSECPNPEVLLTYFDRYYMPEISAQINYGPIGVVYEEEKDANGMLVQKPIPEGKTADELRMENAPYGIIYLNDYAWKNVVKMEDRAALRVERLAAVATPYVPSNVKPCPGLQFTADELNTLQNYETNFYDYVRTNVFEWVTKGGVSDAQWDTFKSELNGKVNLPAIQEVFQNAYNRYIGK